jgi:hypothetical protein
MVDILSYLTVHIDILNGYTRIRHTIQGRSRPHLGNVLGMSLQD